MMKKQREMQGNGGSLGYLSLEVSSNFTWTLMDKTRRGRWGGVLMPLFCFIAVENNCGYHLFESDSEDEEEEVTEKKEVEEPAKKKSAFQVGGRQQNKKSWVSYQIEFFCLSAGVQCLGHQLQDGSERPEEGEEDNEEGREEENKAGDADTTGWRCRFKSELYYDCVIISSTPVTSICMRAS